MSVELRRKIEARKRIYLLRHGDVNYFDGAGRPQPPHSVPLNVDGIVQAEAAAAALLPVPLDRAVHSGLPRTMETAAIILRGRGVAVEECAALREVTPGPFGGAAPRAAGAHKGDGLEGGFEAYFTGAFRGSLTRDSRFLGGESFGEFADRVLPAFQALLSRNDWRHLLIVAHGGVNRVILCHALGTGLEGLARLEQEAGCINVIDVHEDGVLLVRQVNFTPYSPVKDNLWATTLEKIYLEHWERAAAALSRESGAPP
jgi:probable phosphoglycerate mutase